MKKIILIVFILIFSVSFVYAADINGDCNIVLSKDKILSDRDKVEEEDTIKTNLNIAMPKKAMEKAFDNLKSYCCDVKKLSTGYCERTNSDVFYPQSVYLFDHILDVYLRRLDAKQQNDNGNDLLYGLEDPDGSGLEWRKFVTERGNDINGSLPLEMQQKYEQYWKKGIEITPSFMEINGSMQGNWKLDTESAINMYSIWTLFDKYNLACDLSNYITTSILKEQGLVTAEYNSCKKMVKNRIDREKLYVQTILAQKGEKLLGSNMDAYLGTYFVNNKLSELMQTVFNISTSFSEINKAVARLIPQCS